MFFLGPAPALPPAPRRQFVPDPAEEARDFFHQRRAKVLRISLRDQIVPTEIFVLDPGVQIDLARLSEQPAIQEREPVDNSSEEDDTMSYFAKLAQQS